MIALDVVSFVRPVFVLFQRTAVALRLQLDRNDGSFLWRKVILVLSYLIDVVDHNLHRPAVKPPFLTKAIEREMSWRDGDIVISSAFKGGTTWTMNIAYQLREGGDAEFEDLYKEVPWTEFRISPDISKEDHLKNLDKLPYDKRRIFKTHSDPSTLPLNDKVKYIVVFRNPEEAATSAYPFIKSHNNKFMSMWGVPPNFHKFDDFESFYYGFYRPTDRMDGHFNGMKYWWPLRHNPNVLMLHFADMKKDHDGTIKMISKFLGFEHSEEEWERILEYTSLKWMKAHKEKFNLGSFFEFPFLVDGNFVRNGSMGSQKDEGMTKEIALDIYNTGKEILGDEIDAFDWLYSGGIMNDFVSISG